MRDVVIKASIENAETIKSKAKELSGSEPTIIQQVDTFYAVSKGRLKLREFSDGSGELLYYERPNTEGPKVCDYLKTKFNNKKECEGIDKILGKIHGYVGVLKKTRLLYFVGTTRIHIDDVADLGSFMEIEVVLEDDQDMEVGEQTCNDLMAKLGISANNLIATAYIDLLLQKKKDKRE